MTERATLRARTPGTNDATAWAYVLEKLQHSIRGEAATHQLEFSTVEVYAATVGQGALPTQFVVCGEDGFYAKIPWSFAARAVFHFPTVDQPGSAEDGLRLFVQDSDNACLNVKSIVRIEFDYEGELEQPMFGSKVTDGKVIHNQD